LGKYGFEHGDACVGKISGWVRVVWVEVSTRETCRAGRLQDDKTSIARMSATIKAGFPGMIISRDKIDGIILRL
jgi:hypothetical protein